MWWNDDAWALVIAGRYLIDRYVWMGWGGICKDGGWESVQHSLLTSCVRSMANRLCSLVLWDVIDEDLFQVPLQVRMDDESESFNRQTRLLSQSKFVTERLVSFGQWLNLLPSYRHWQTETINRTFRHTDNSELTFCWCKYPVLTLGASVEFRLTNFLILVRFVQCNCYSSN